MATVELIAELHEIKESMCDAVRYNPYFSYVHQKRSYRSGLLYGPTWTDVGNATQQFECLVMTCVKGNVCDIEIKKFKLKEKIPTVNKNVPHINGAQMAYYNANIVYINSFNNMMPIDILKELIRIASNSNEYYYYPNLDTQATALHTRLTTLIDMIPVKKVYEKKVVIKKELTPPTPVVVKISPSTQTQPTLSELKPQTQPKQEELKKTPLTPLNPKTKTHQISLENYEIRALKQSDCLLQINNLSEFANVQFYFHKLQYNELYLHYKGHAQYLIGNDHKLYVISGARLVQGSHYDKLQCWTF